MPDARAVDRRAADRLLPLLVVCALAIASLLVASVGVTPVRVSAQEAMGAARDPGDRALIASHRGGADAAPENTLPAVRAALAAGFDYVEVDLQLTADRHIVLLHDATVDRTTDGHGALATLTLADVRRLDAGSSYSAEFAGTRVPTAIEFLDLLAETGGRAILDLKGAWDAAAAADLVAQIDVRGLERRVIVASFDARTLAWIAARSTVISQMVILKTLPADVVEATRQIGARGILVERKALLREPDVVERLHAAKLRVVVYTLNDDRQWDAATDLGVDGIVTDDPGLLDSWQRSLASG